MNEVARNTTPETSLDRLGNTIDRVVMALSPERGAKRIATRYMLAASQERADRIKQTKPRNASHEGARTDRLRGDRWLGSKLSPDSDLEDDLQTLRDRCRELYTNDSIGGAVESRVTHVVGSGMKFQSRINPVELGITEEAAKQLQRQIESLVRKVSKRIDRDRVRPLWMIQRLIERNVCNDGEAFVVMSDVGHAELPIPLCLEVIDADRVETPPDKINDPRVRLGIEKDARGVIVAYHVRKSHPGDTVETDTTYERVPAGRMIHVFEQLFAGQSRGKPWLHRVMNRIRDAKDLDEATIISAQVQACFSAFIKNTVTPGSTAALNNSNGSPNSSGHLLQELEPATIKYLDDGQEPVFAQPSQPGNTYQPFMQWTYQRIAAGLNWAYQLITKDWSGLSFAGGRLVLSEVKIDTRCRQQMLIDQCMSRVAERIIDEGVILGVLPIDARAYEADPDLYRSHSWTPQAWAYAINPGEEVKANQQLLDGNMGTLADILAADGKDLEETLDQRQREIQMQRDREILPLEATGAPPPPELDPEKQDAESAAAA